MNRTLQARLTRIDGGAAAIGSRADRAAWWAWRGKPWTEWPEDALEAFTRCADARDPECRAEIGRMSDADLNWSLSWMLKRANLLAELGA